MASFRDSPTAPIHLEHDRKKAEALKLRVAGHGFRGIAAQMCVSVSTAHDLVRESLEDLVASQRESAQQLIDLENQRLDEMQFALQEKVNEGNPRAIDSALRVMVRRAKLNGLDAATKHEVTGANGAPLQGPRMFVPSFDPESDSENKSEG